MWIKPDVVYEVTKGNTDGSVINGDLLVLASKDGSLNLYNGHGGWLERDELTDEVMDIEAKEATAYEFYSDRWRMGVRKKK